MKKTITIILLALLLTHPNETRANSSWQIQSIDTMKYSRDLAREKHNNKDFDKTIEALVANIASTGVSHIAIGTPYDDEFIPYLTRWAGEVRKHNLKVWFRGNFSGWEGWFNYPKISQSQHVLQLAAFISKNPTLFEDGDIFTPCTECENGGPGDPRITREIDSYRNFLILERDTAVNAFNTINKKVEAGYFSMNGDVARLIMNKNTTQKLGGVIVVDHYARDIDQLVSDLEDFAKISGGKVVVGEFGAPIPDLHGDMTEETQSQWIDQALSKISKNPNIIGLNYWVAEGGTTAIWNENKARKAVETITNYFKSKEITIKVVNALQKPIEGAQVSEGGKKYSTSASGMVTIDQIPAGITITKDGYKNTTIESAPRNNTTITMQLEKESLWFKIKKFMHSLRFKLFVNKS